MHVCMSFLFFLSVMQECFGVAVYQHDLQRVISRVSKGQSVVQSIFLLQQEVGRQKSVSESLPVDLYMYVCLFCPFPQ